MFPDNQVMSGAGHCRRRGEQGFVLIVTLWVMVILGVMLTHLGYQVRAEAQVERRTLNLAELRWAARGAVHLAASQVREHLQDDYHSPLDDWWSDEALYRDLPLGKARVSLLKSSQESVSFGLDDEESRLNINIAHPEDLMGFAGIPSVLAEDIVLFRLRLEEKRQQADDAGESEPTENEEGETRELVDGPIQSLRELLAIEGVTEELLFESQDDQPPLAELLTTVSSGKVNINTASTALLTALGFDDGQLETILEKRTKAQKGEQEQTPFTSAADIAALFAGGEQSKRQQRVLKILDVRSGTFRLLARATLPRQRKPYRIKATLAAGADALAFIRWQEY